MPSCLRAGQLAARAGVTVRALHHYEAAGLLRPERTSAGHRRYGPAEIERLQQITSLRALGVPLAAIGETLDADAFDPAALVERQRASLDAEAARIARLTDTLDGLARLLRLRAATGQPVSSDAFLSLLATMNDLQTHYSPEQLQQLTDRRDALGDEAIGAVEAEWPQLFDAVGRAMDAGTDPADPTVQAFVDRWDELVGMFTGGDAGTRQSLDDTWSAALDGMAGMMGLAPDRLRALFAYAQRAREARP